MVSLSPTTDERPAFALAYAWAGVAIMWAFWVSFVIFLAEPRQILTWWPLPTVDNTDSAAHPALAAIVDVALVMLFGLQHSVMARPWFKQQVMARMPEPLQRVTYVHLANAALFLVILMWQPITIELWDLNETPAHEVLWLLFAAGWLILFLGAWSFGINELLGIDQVMAWRDGARHTPRLKTGFLYRWLRHPMYVGVLMGIWVTPRMSFGHLLLALGMTASDRHALRGAGSNAAVRQ
jgi:methanethiol S-methyltransferase